VDKTRTFSAYLRRREFLPQSSETLGEINDPNPVIDSAIFQFFGFMRITAKLQSLEGFLSDFARTFTRHNSALFQPLGFGIAEESVNSRPYFLDAAAMEI
jgi:hypothetical protein